MSEDTLTATYWTKQRLLEHLPMVYRQRDAEIAAREGLPEGPLGSLLGVLSGEIGKVESNIEQLYANWFVETCDPWVLPYIGSLLGIERLPPASSAAYSPRAYVANMIGYRRRKGTPGMLAQLARDTTGWYARVEENFLSLTRTQHLNRVRLNEVLAPDIRDLEPLEKLSGAFTKVHRIPEVRNVDAPLPGRFNIPNIGMQLWRLKSYAPPDATGETELPVARFAIEARPVPFPASEGDPVARWALSPLGQPIRLFNRPLSLDPSGGGLVSGPTGERDVPEPLRRLPLHRELEALRQSIVDGSPAPELHYFGDNRPVIQLFADNELTAIPPEQIRIVDFTHGWPAPSPTHAYQPSDGGAPVSLPIRAAIDPVRGEIAFSPGAEPRQLRAVYAYGFTMDMGGGPYDRSKDARSSLTAAIDWQIGVSRLLDPVPNEIVGSLIEAIQLWNALPAGSNGLICILDSMRYREELTGDNRIRIPSGSSLTILAADWPARETEPGIFERSRGVYSPDRLMPHILGNIEVEGTADASDENPGSIALEGAIIEGNVTVLNGHLGRIELAHCTIPVNLQRLQINADDSGRNDELRVFIKRSRLGRIECGAFIEKIDIHDSIVGRPGEPATASVHAPLSPICIDRSTIWGAVAARQADISESILLGILEVERTQIGCVRYSYLTPGSQSPRQFRCQPHLAVVAANAESLPSLTAQIHLRTRPTFESMEPEDATFARLAETCAIEIREGGENGREMGVFCSLDEPIRERFLSESLDEFLRAGLKAGIQNYTTSSPVNYGHAS